MLEEKKHTALRRLSREAEQRHRRERERERGQERDARFNVDRGKGDSVSVLLSPSAVAEEDGVHGRSDSFVLEDNGLPTIRDDEGGAHGGLFRTIDGVDTPSPVPALEQSEERRKAQFTKKATGPPAKNEDVQYRHKYRQTFWHIS